MIFTYQHGYLIHCFIENTQSIISYTLFVNNYNINFRIISIMTKTNQLTPTSQPQKITEQAKLTIPIAQKVSQQQRQAIFHKFIEKHVPHEKHLLRKTKLIKKKKAEAIAFMNLDKNQVAKAVECLKKFDSSQQSHPNLFTEDAFIYLQIDLSRVPQHYSIRPVHIPLPHPIYTQAYNSKFTIFTLNPSAQQIQNNNQTQHSNNQAKVDKEWLAPKSLSDLNLGQLSQITYEQVKKQYCENIDKLKLIAANDLFFCDWKLYNLLRLPLGKVFYDKKKYPFPIDCQQVPQELASKYSSYREYIQDLTNYTYFMMGNGPVYSLKIGRISMPVQQLVKNILRGTFRTLPYILGAQLSPSDVRQITIKTHNSPSLPIYSYINPNYVQTYKTYENNPNKPKPQQKLNKKQKPQKKGKISRFYKQKRQQKKEQK